jgi:ubiquinone/menaquinone biosynthesis C-methylase UbiE
VQTAATSAGAVPIDPYAVIAGSFDELAAQASRWSRRTRSYHDLVTAINQAIVPSGHSVLEIGSVSGDLLAALAPRVGVGVDVSSGMVELARSRHPELRFEVGAGEDIAF